MIRVPLGDQTGLSEEEDQEEAEERQGPEEV
jgi:hypothetical protein